MSELYVRHHGIAHYTTVCWVLDYEKTFDSVQPQAILTSLQEQGIEDVYIEILKDIIRPAQ